MCQTIIKMYYDNHFAQLKPLQNDQKLKCTLCFYRVVLNIMCEVIIDLSSHKNLIMAYFQILICHGDV